LEKFAQKKIFEKKNGKLKNPRIPKIGKIQKIQKLKNPKNGKMENWKN